jgi:copper(I)-binding protein
VNRISNRLFAASAGLVACGLILTGCGAGQISQTATQEAAVNGTSAGSKNIALRNVHLQAVQTSDFIQPGQSVPLVFLAANESPDVDDKLVSITSDVGTVALAGDLSVPAGRALIVAPKGEVQAMGSATPATAAVTLTEPITNGLMYNFTFNFEKAGATAVAVPISAGEGARD